MVMATIELSARPEAREVTVNALHPGSLLDTKMVREGFGRPQRPGRDRHPLRSSRRRLRRPRRRHRQYFDRTQPAVPRRKPIDDTARRRLWQISERLVGIAGDA